MKMDISIVVSFLDEEETIEVLVSKLNKYISTLSPLKVEVIFVDDGSTDGSIAMLQRLGHSSYAASIIKLSKNYGSHSALRAGILHSSGEFVTFLPADLQDPLELIGELYKKCKEGYDVVFAFRRNIESNLPERLFSKLYAKLVRIFIADTFPESGFDIAMFNQKIKDELNQNIEANSSLFLQIFTLGFKQAAITYDKKLRLAGTSKWTFSKKIKMAIDSFVAFSYAPIRFVSITGIALSLLGFIWMSYIILRTIFIRDVMSGWPSLVAILMIGFGLTNISLGIIAEYLWRTLDASRHRKVFIIDKIINCSKV